MVGMPLLGLLKWLRLMHDEVFLNVIGKVTDGRIEVRVRMVADETGVVGDGRKKGKEGRASVMCQVQGAVKMERGKTVTDLFVLIGMGETYGTGDGMMARGVLFMQLSGCVIMTMRRVEDVWNAGNMLEVDEEGKIDGDDGNDVVVVSCINAISILTRCGGGLFDPVLEQVLGVIAFITKVVGEIVGLVNCDVGVFTLMVLLVVIAVVALLPHVVTRRRGVAVV